MLKTLLILALFLALAEGCGKKLEPEIDNPFAEKNSSNATPWLGGNWEGMYIEDASGPANNDEKAHDIQLQFHPKKRFVLRFNEKNNSYISGTYFDTERKIILSITKSTTNLIGRLGGKLVMDFTLNGDDLNFTHKKFALFLKRSGDNQNTEPGHESTGLVGTWNCKNPNNSFDAILQANQTFQLHYCHLGNGRCNSASGQYHEGATTNPSATFEIYDEGTNLSFALARKAGTGTMAISWDDKKITVPCSFEP